VRRRAAALCRGDYRAGSLPELQSPAVRHRRHSPVRRQRQPVSSDRPPQIACQVRAVSFRTPGRPWRGNRITMPAWQTYRRHRRWRAIVDFERPAIWAAFRTLGFIPASAASSRNIGATAACAACSSRRRCAFRFGRTYFRPPRTTRPRPVLRLRSDAGRCMFLRPPATRRGHPGNVGAAPVLHCHAAGHDCKRSLTGYGKFGRESLFQLRARPISST